MMDDAIRSMQERAQNAQTCHALTKLCRQFEAEQRELASENALLRAELAAAYEAAETTASRQLARIKELMALVEQRDQLRNVCAEAYQMAGALFAPTAALDNLSAAAAGEQLPHETFLPVATPCLIEQLDLLLEALNNSLELPTVVLWWAERFKLPEGLIESAKRYDAETRAAIDSIEKGKQVA